MVVSVHVSRGVFDTPGSFHTSSYFKHDSVCYSTNENDHKHAFCSNSPMLTLSATEEVVVSIWQRHSQMFMVYTYIQVVRKIEMEETVLCYSFNTYIMFRITLCYVYTTIESFFKWLLVGELILVIWQLGCITEILDNLYYPYYPHHPLYNCKVHFSLQIFHHFHNVFAVHSYHLCLCCYDFLLSENQHITIENLTLISICWHYNKTTWIDKSATSFSRAGVQWAEPKPEGGVQTAPSITYH